MSAWPKKAFGGAPTYGTSSVAIEQYGGILPTATSVVARGVAK